MELGSSGDYGTLEDLKGQYCSTRFWEGREGGELEREKNYQKE